MKTISKILVPTDFSDCSRDAFHVAIDIANKINAAVEVVHFYVLPIDNNLPEAQNFILPEAEYLRILEDKMNNFIHFGFHNSFEREIATKTNITHRIEIGFPKEKIVEYSKNPEIGLIVIGASGEHPNFSRFFGSITTDVATDAYCPVLIAPLGRRFARFDDIMYSCNEESSHKEALTYVLNWTRIFSSRLHLVHVKHLENADDTFSFDVTNKLIEDIDSDVEIIFESVINKVTWKGLYAYADTARVDLMVIETKHRNFFQNLIHNSLTESISADAHLPLLVLHKDDKGIY